jgi:hypothetical protein
MRGKEIDFEGVVRDGDNPHLDCSQTQTVLGRGHRQADPGGVSRRYVASREIVGNSLLAQRPSCGVYNRGSRLLRLGSLSMRSVTMTITTLTDS